jgi:hypothetical protein
VQAAKGVAERNNHFIGIVKTGHSKYPKKFIEDTMIHWPAGSHLVLENKSKDLLAVGYKYNKRRVLCFLATTGAGHTEPGDPYEARWKDENGNTNSRDIPRPEVCSKYFNFSNSIDVHNQSRQFDLKLEKHWLTNNGYFRIITTLFGMMVTDAWNAYRYHLDYRHRHKNIPIAKFPSILCKDCLYNGFSKESSKEMALTIGVKHRAQDEQSPVSALTTPSSVAGKPQATTTDTSNTPSPGLSTLCRGMMKDFITDRHQLVLNEAKESYRKHEIDGSYREGNRVVLVGI